MQGPYKGQQDLIRYERQLQTLFAQTEALILKQQPTDTGEISELINEEQILCKYLQVEVSKISFKQQAEFAKKLTRYKKKIKEHKDFAFCFFGSSERADRGSPLEVMRNKQKIMETMEIQEGIAVQLKGQGDSLQAALYQNQNILSKTVEAETTLGLVQKVMLKRRWMFGSLLILFFFALIFVIYSKVKKHGST